MSQVALLQRNLQVVRGDTSELLSWGRGHIGTIPDAGVDNAG